MILLLAIFAQILQPASAWTPEEQCAADVQRICHGQYVMCKGCVPCPPVAICPTPAPTPDLFKIKACVTKTAKVTAKRCFP